jgi:hypothetical protein
MEVMPSHLHTFDCRCLADFASKKENYKAKSDLFLPVIWKSTLYADAKMCRNSNFVLVQPMKR